MYVMEYAVPEGVMVAESADRDEDQARGVCGHSAAQGGYRSVPVTVPDLSLAGSARELELAHQDWVAVMRSGCVGAGHRWDRG